jgi:hypothetical protein
VANFGDMTNAVLTACKLRPDTDQASVRRVINDAYLAVARTLDLLQTSKVVTFTAGQQDYSITNDLGIDDLLSLETIIGPSSGNLANVTMEATYPSRLLALRSTTTVSSDAPWMFALYGIDTLMLYPGPISNAAATLYYTKQPVALYDDSDEPELLPRDLHWVVEERAVELAASRWARNSQLAADAHARYQLGLGEARSWLSERDGVWPKEIATLSTIHAARRRPADRSTDY